MDALRITKTSVSNIAEAVDIALEHIPVTVSTSDTAPGRKVYFGLPMKKHPKSMADFIYVYAESKLPKPPTDLITGYTESDVFDTSGVYLFKKIGDVISGCTYMLEEFLDKIDDLSLRNRLIYRVKEMREMVHLDDSFLEVANHEWSLHKNPHSFGIQRLH